MPPCARAHVRVFVRVVILWCTSDTGTNDRAVYVYDIESRACVGRLTGHGDDVNAGAQNPCKPSCSSNCVGVRTIATACA
jgi:hypothetical protein